MTRYIVHIETNHPNYEEFVELSVTELKNAQNDSIELAQEYAYVLNDINALDRPLFHIFRITIYEKYIEFPDKGIATYQSVSQRISKKRGFYEHYTDIVHFANSQFYRVRY